MRGMNSLRKHNNTTTTTITTATQHWESIDYTLLQTVHYYDTTQSFHLPQSSAMSLMASTSPHQRLSLSSPQSSSSPQYQILSNIRPSSPPPFPPSLSGTSTPTITTLRRLLHIMSSSLNAARLKVAALSLLCIIFVAGIVLFMIPDSPAQRYLLDLMNWIEGVPKTYGTLTLTVMYAVAMIFCFPGTPFNLAAGFLFGIWLGTAVTIVGCSVGATLAFLLGRTLGKDWAQEQVSRNKKFSLVSLAVEQNAWLIIFLVRLSPVLPFGLCNYLFGITKVKFSSYWSATTCGLIPCTVAYTYLGSLMRDLTDMYSEDGGDSNSTIYVCVAIIATVVGITAITLVTKRTLDKTIKQQQELEMEKVYLDDKPILSNYKESIINSEHMV